MPLTESQKQNRKEKLLKYADEKDLTMFEMLLESEEKNEERAEYSKECMDTMKSEIIEAIQSIEKPQEYTGQLKEIMDKLNEPEEDEEIVVTLNII